ncbi:MAG: hypothetical protein WKF43_02230 [Acidimicrobiales bacterium]
MPADQVKIAGCQLEQHLDVGWIQPEQCQEPDRRRESGTDRFELGLRSGPAHEWPRRRLLIPPTSTSSTTGRAGPAEPERSRAVDQFDGGEHMAIFGGGDDHPGDRSDDPRSTQRRRPPLR